MSNVFTIGQLARLHDRSVARMRYCLLTYGPPAAGRVAHYQIWTKDQLPAIARSLKKIDENRRTPLRIK